MCGLTQASLYTGEHFQDKQPTFGEEKSNSWTLTGYEDERSCTHAQKKYANGRDFSERGLGGRSIHKQNHRRAQTSWKQMVKAAAFNEWTPSVWSSKKPASEVTDCTKSIWSFQDALAKTYDAILPKHTPTLSTWSRSIFFDLRTRNRRHLQLTFCWPTTWQHNDPLTIKRGHIWSMACVASFSHYYFKKKTLSSCNKELPYRYESGAQMHYCLVLNYAQCKQWHTL